MHGYTLRAWHDGELVVHATIATPASPDEVFARHASMRHYSRFTGTVRLYQGHYSETQNIPATELLSESEVVNGEVPLPRFGEWMEFLDDIKAREHAIMAGTINEEGPNGWAWYYRQALKVAYEFGFVSNARVQRRMMIGYEFARWLVHRLEERGVVGPKDKDGRSWLL